MLDKVTADMVLKFEIDSKSENKRSSKKYSCTIILVNHTKKKKDLTMDSICALFSKISDHNILVEEKLKNRIKSHLFLEPWIQNSAKETSEYILTQFFAS